MKWGTVAITGANGQVGRQLLASLRGRCETTIALVREPADLPASEVIADWTNSAETREAIARSEAIVHLAGSLKPARGDYAAANLETTQALLSELAGDRTRRLVFLSYVGAHEEATNPYLGTKARAERLLRESGRPVTIFRCTHIVGSPHNPGRTAQNWLVEGGKPVLVLGSGRQQIAPIYLDDVVGAIVAALDRDRDGIFELAGPECRPLDEWIRAFNGGDRVKLVHLPAFIARWLPRIVPDLPGALIEVMLADSIGNPDAAIAAFGIQLTSLTQVWRSD